MKEVTLTFTCGTNHALLLLTFYDIILGAVVDDSIAMMDSMTWVIDEVGQRAPEVVRFLESGKGGVPWQLRELARIYKHSLWEDGDRPPGEDGDRPPGEDGDRPPGEDGDGPPGEDGDRPPEQSDQ